MDIVSFDVFTTAGSVGIAILLILYAAYKDKLYNKTINNHLTHLTEVLSDLKTEIKNQSDSTNRNTDILRRVERVLDRNGKSK